MPVIVQNTDMLFLLPTGFKSERRDQHAARSQPRGAMGRGCRTMVTTEDETVNINISEAL